MSDGDEQGERNKNVLLLDQKIMVEELVTATAEIKERME